ncbi:hypothetical protein LA52FAK_06790 [Desulforhopalus sp. 52FAK]
MLQHQPIAILAAIIVIAVVGLFQIATLLHSYKVNPHDTVVAFVVFNTAISFVPHFEKGEYIGIGMM